MICLKRKTFDYLDETIKLLENDYHFPKASHLAEEANTMCNLSEGIYEKGIKEGIKEGVSKTVESWLRKRLTCEFISDNFDIPIETVKQIAEEMSCTV